MNQLISRFPLFFNIRKNSFLNAGLAMFVGIGGVLGIFGPTPEQSVLGKFFWTNQVENRGHFFFGLMFLLAGLFLPTKYIKYLIAFTAALQYFLVYISIQGGIPNGVYFLGASLENPGDTFFHLFTAIMFTILLYVNMEQPSNLKTINA